jgi:hypothetical protein
MPKSIGGRLGHAVAKDGSSKPSKSGSTVQRRAGPGLTQTTQASASFAPLQSLFGIVTASDLHFAATTTAGGMSIRPSTL